VNDLTPPSGGMIDPSRIVTYYGLPSVKPSLWGWLVSSYIFAAGIGGSAQVIAAMADFAGHRSLIPVVRRGRYVALSASLISAPLLIIDLHTPRRWYNMLRIFRKTSPMSIGTYVLMSFGALSTALAAAQFAEDRGPSPNRPIRARIKALQAPAALAGMAMSTYTGALLSSTSTPLWAAAPRRIAALFGASAMASGAATLTIATKRDAGGGEAARALGRLSLLTSAVELALSLSLRARFREQGVDGALHATGLGAAYDIGVVALGAGLPLLHHGARELAHSKPAPKSTVVIPLIVLAGGLLLRQLLLRAGNISAGRPRDYFHFAGSHR
jgi:protein NrfD